MRSIIYCCPIKKRVL